VHVRYRGPLGERDKDIPDLLPGRSETIELWPLSQGEIGRAADGFVDAVFEHGATLTAAESPLRREGYLERVLRGGYPEAVRRTDLGRGARFFESYVSDLISRDVRQVSEIERPADMRRLLNLVAASMATLAVTATFANHLRLPASTVERYLDLLELLYIVRRIPAWSTNLTTTITRLMLWTTAPLGTETSASPSRVRAAGARECRSDAPPHAPRSPQPLPQPAARPCRCRAGRHGRW
jgi:predicted AAA+ superfamily ATPase